jgi:acetyl-CoA acetyltransferase
VNKQCFHQVHDRYLGAARNSFHTTLHNVPIRESTMAFSSFATPGRPGGSRLTGPSIAPGNKICHRLELGQPLLAKFCGATAASVPPSIMGIGPAAAIPKLLRKFQLTKEDIDIFEVNEAFASMIVCCLEHLSLDHKKVNPRGGSIALGHSLGGTGARLICTILCEARKRRRRS